MNFNVKKVIYFILFFFLLIILALFLIHSNNHKTLSSHINTFIKQQKNIIDSFPKCSNSPITLENEFIKLNKSAYEKVRNWNDCNGILRIREFYNYSGGWKYGKEHYFGEWSNGEDQYIGGFINGKKDGYGQKSNFGELINEGLYKEGKFIN